MARRYKVVLLGVEETPPAAPAGQRHTPRALQQLRALSWQLQLAFVLVVFALSVLLIHFGG